jgi:para-aminobenzoate synthetase component I
MREVSHVRQPERLGHPRYIRAMFVAWEPEGAFVDLERWLADQGFFQPGADELTADLYLGYGLSQALRRDDSASPPEPCALPLIAAAVTRDVPPGGTPGGARSPLRIGAWECTWTAAEHAAAVEVVRDAIARGDVYQVNIVQHLAADFSGNPRDLAQRLAPLRPLVKTPFVGDRWAVVSGSPELFLERRGDHVRTMPIKGTRPQGAAIELAASPKDAAEHVMIVDLERNDLSRVCRPGTVRWPDLMRTEAMAGVEHMVSTVEGRLRPGVGLAELLEATFPGGSITGAPKIAAVDLIASIEPVGRGASMGAIGRVHGNGDLELALTIRTFAIESGRIHFWVGGGIVWDSNPLQEVEESWTKAAPILGAIGAPIAREVPRETAFRRAR